MPSGGVLRSVVYDDDVANLFDYLSRTYDRFSELWQAIEWQLARNPNVGLRVRTTRIEYRIVRTSAWMIHGVPVIEVAYYFDETTVYVEFAREIIDER